MPKADPPAVPRYPVPAVGVVCLRPPGEVLLIRRGKPPGAGGWSLLLLAMFYGVIDVLGFKRWAFPFQVIGANAIWGV